MVKKWLKLFTEDIFAFSKKQRSFSLFVIIAIFFIMFEYGMSCPASTSVFISQFSTKSLPYVYLFIVPLNFVIVSLYNRIILLLGVYKTFILTLILISSIHLLCASFADTFPLLIFFQYAFRDIYILLLFKQLWSMIHATMDVSKAKYLYTLPFLVGSLGAIIGSLLPALLAISVGSLKLFYLTPFIYLFLYLAYKKAFSLGSFNCSSDYLLGIPVCQCVC